MKSNSLSWNPTLPTVLLLASEDHNLYTFDIRQLTTPTQIYKDHVAAVTSCEWSPTGEEFSSGGWDRTVRVWKRDEGKSRDVYHTKRMQRITDVTYTPTSTFVLTASDDGNVRIWKANSTDSLGVMDSRERASREYRAKLVEKWGKTSSVRRIESCVLFLSSDCLHSPLFPRLLADSVSPCACFPQATARPGLDQERQFAQARDARLAQEQGREPPTTHQGRTRETKGREEEGHARGRRLSRVSLSSSVGGVFGRRGLLYFVLGWGFLACPFPFLIQPQRAKKEWS